MMITTCIDTKIRGGKDGKTIDLRKFIQVITNQNKIYFFQKANEEERQQQSILIPQTPQVAPTSSKLQTPLLAEITPAKVVGVSKVQTPTPAITPASSGFTIFEDTTPTSSLSHSISLCAVKPKTSEKKKPFQDITSIKNAEPIPQEVQPPKTSKTPNKTETKNFFAIEEESFTQNFEKQLIRPISTPSPGMFIFLAVLMLSS